MFPEREEKVGELNLNTHKNIITIIKSKYKMLEKKIPLMLKCSIINVNCFGVADSRSG